MTLGFIVTHGHLVSNSMPFRTLDPAFARLKCVLVCDDCDRLLTIDGTVTAKTFAESDPDDLAPHYEKESDLRRLALGGAWTTDGARWSCPRCTRPPI